jgi:hypothetical protein
MTIEGSNATADFDELRKRFLDTTDASERLLLLKEMSALLRCLHLLLKAQASAFVH